MSVSRMVTIKSILHVVFRIALECDVQCTLLMETMSTPESRVSKNRIMKCSQGWQKKTGNTSISQDAGKYWEFPGNTRNSREMLGFTAKFLNMTLI